MKKRIGLILLALTLGICSFAGCGSIREVRDSGKPDRIIKEKDSDSGEKGGIEDVQPGATDSSTTDTGDSTDSPTSATGNTTDDASLVIDESYLSIYCDYLKDNIADEGWGMYFNSRECGPMYAASFCVYDIDGDGYKELIVSGALGLRCKEFSEIWIWNGTYMVSQYYDGSPAYAENGLVWFADGDYELMEEGERMYNHEYADYIAPSDKPSYDKLVITECIEGDEDWIEQEVDEQYKIGGKSVTADEFENAVAKLFSSPYYFQFIDLNLENVNEYFGG